jgi:peptide/nickel transport system substrate-binding protein
MRVDQAPFNDVKVRQAFRLIVDRQAMIDQTLSG